MENQEKKYNILYINDNSALFGAERCLINIIENLDRTKFAPFVLLPNEGLLEKKLKEMRIEPAILNFRFKATKTNPIIFINLITGFIRLVKEKKIDLIHINLYHHSANFWLAFSLLKLPIIIHVRGKEWIDFFQKLVMFRYAKKILFISEYAKEEFFKKRRSDFLFKINKNRLDVIYDGIDVNRFTPKDDSRYLREEFKVKNDETLIGLIGAINSNKGQDILIEAAKDVLKKYPKVKFLIVGDPYLNEPERLAYKSEIINRIATYGLKDNVLVSGFRDDIPEVMNAIDILVQPSKYEGLGISMIEAMACKKPVIGTNVGGIPEVICDNKAGILLKERTPRELAEAIIFLLAHPEDAMKKGTNGRQIAVDKFNIERNIKRIEEIYFEEIAKSDRYLKSDSLNYKKEQYAKN